MFQSIFDRFLQAVSNLLLFSWAHPVAAGLMLSSTAFLLLIWLHVPKRLEYYWQNGQVTINPFNVRNELSQCVRGRIAVLRFCRRYGIELALCRRIGLAFLEFFLKVVQIPNPRKFSWEHWFAATEMYPLGRSRREYVVLCIKHRVWPWKRTQTLHRILDQNDGQLPVFKQSMFWISLVNRLYG